MRRITRTVCVAALLSVIASSAMAVCDTGEMVIKLGYAAADTKSVPARFARSLQPTINKELQGRACLQALNFPGPYGGDRDLSALSAGRVQLALPTLSEVGDRVSGYRIFGIPFAFRDYFAVERLTGSAAYRALAQEASQNGLQPLGMLHESLWHIASAKPVIEPTDVSGLRVRDSVPDGIGSIARALNATAQPIAAERLRPAIRDGTVGLVSGGWIFLNGMKADEEFFSFTQTSHAYTGYVLATAPAWWNGIEEKLRSDIAAAVTRAIAEINGETVAADSAARSEIIARGKPVYTLTQVQRRSWTDALSSTRGRFEPQLSQALINANTDP